MKTLRQSKRYPELFVRKYHRKVFFKNLWHTDPELVESRGHVLTAEGKVVIRPFTKVFNRGENDTDIPLDENVLAVNKINGFMCAATYVPEVKEVVISTTGSLDSDFAIMAAGYINKQAIECVSVGGEIYTFLFEIVDPADPHIIEEDCGAYLIGARFVSDDTPYTSSLAMEKMLDYFALIFGCKRPKYKVSSFKNILLDAKACKHEGFVVYGKDTTLKLKSPYYLALKAAARCKDIEKLNKERVEEEFYPLIDYLIANKEHYLILNEQEKLDYMKNYLYGE